MKMLVEKMRFAATTDFSEISKVDFIAICVPTPLDADGGRISAMWNHR